MYIDTRKIRKDSVLWCSLGGGEPKMSKIDLTDIKIIQNLEQKVYKPIIVEEIILLNLGFKEQSKLGQRRFFAIGNLSVELIPDGIAVYFCGTLLYFKKYLHELQNIYLEFADEEIDLSQLLH